MMASLSILPIRRRDDRGCIHVFHHEDGSFEIGHESRSGNSWGNFSTYSSADEAVSAAFAINRDEYEGECDVHVAEAIQELLTPCRAPLSDRGEF